MVVSDMEKQEIIRQEDWTNWTTADGTGAERWRQIEAFRAGEISTQHNSKVTPPDIRNFLADVQTRHLLAEYIRRVHHERAADVISQHQQALGRFAFDDLVLQNTIADICVAHGLSRELLDDRTRFPTLRQIRGEDCNVRLLAVLLRIGDLLDLSTSRACPLLLNAACPLPPESLVHWGQYNRIMHFAASPQSIALRAECDTPEEHRVLRDWCQWIEDEVGFAPKLLAGSERHQGWSPPIARMNGDSATITIKPSAHAKYRPCDWRFELDETAVFTRLTSDVYESPLSFVRELIQNALDAMRCQMYEELRVEGAVLPASPTDVTEMARERFPLWIRLSEEQVLNERSGEPENRQVITFEDSGIGMDEEIIRNHFLQVGRSYYTTPDFRRRYSFTPTSRFGIGFLSVFNVSSHVTVETLRVSTSNAVTSIRLTLTGPRNYLIVEDGDRRDSGTTIRVRLNRQMELSIGQLTTEIGNLCRRVEFPIFVDEFGRVTEIKAEQSSDFTFEIEDAEREGGSLLMKAFPFKDNTSQGEIYILARKDATGNEDWACRAWYEHEYRKTHPEADILPLVSSLVCLHGMSVNFPHASAKPAVRQDVRGQLPQLVLSRERHTAWTDIAVTRGARDQLRELLDAHLRHCALANGQDGWRYLNRLADQFPDMSFWAARHSMIPLYSSGVRSFFSFK
jgi:molecular chaperone HtpG